MASSERRYTKTVREASATGDGDVEDAVEDPIEIDEEIDSRAEDETPGSYEHRISLHEEELAQRRKSAIDAGRRKGGAVGAAMAGAMLAVQEILEKPKEEAPVVIEANSKPEDLDSEGITVELDGTNYHTPPLERIESTDRKTGTL